MPSYSSGCTEVSRGSRELTWRRSPFCFRRPFQKLPNKPLYRDYPTCFSSLSSHCFILESCSSPPRRVPLGGASKSHGAFPSASPGMASSCSRSLQGAPVSSAPGEEHGASRSPAGSRRPDRSNDGTESSVQVHKGQLPSGRIRLPDRQTTACALRSCTPSRPGARTPLHLPILRLDRSGGGM